MTVGDLIKILETMNYDLDVHVQVGYNRFDVEQLQYTHNNVLLVVAEDANNPDIEIGPRVA